MSNKIASKRYSTALFDSVKNEELDALLKDAQSLSETMSDSEELSSLLKSPLTKEAEQYLRLRFQISSQKTS